MLTVDVEVIRGGEGWNSVAMAGAEVTEPSDDLNGPGIEPQWGKGRRWGRGQFSRGKDCLVCASC